jgi:archaellin
MGITRTYFTKDTTIVRNSCVNTGRNPITEIFYGGSTNINDTRYSRYLFDIDFTQITGNTSCTNISGMTHTLKMTNTSCFDKELYCRTNCSSVGDVRRATSFDLVVFTIPEPWDEGNGYDYVDTTAITCEEANKTYCESPANWLERTTNTNWVNAGTYSGNPETFNGGIVIGTQHFDHGDENLCVDITSFINNLLLTGDTSTFYGLGVAYKYSQEIITDDDTFYVGFFGRETNTVYEPFIETTFDNTIKDDRNHFYLDKDNRLYLYVNAGGQPVDATFDNVIIRDHNENTYQTIPYSAVTKQSCGVYYVTVNVPNSPISGYCGNIMFTDTWTNITINSNILGDSEQEFVLRDENSYYTVGTTMAAGANGLGVGSSSNLSIYDYAFRVSGIKHQEKIKRGDTRRVNVEARIPLTLDQVGVLDKIYYRIYIREGNTQIDYIDWTEISRAFDGNFFLVDTSWFIPNDYYLEVKIQSGDETRTYDDVIKFEIVSEKDWC